MSIICDDGDERQRRVDLMIDEFRQAQSRRLAKAATVKSGAQVVEFQRDAQTPQRLHRATPHTSH